jgi:hypothetical protein
MLTQAELKKLLIYDPDTGVFVNRITRNPRAPIGAIAGTDHPDGYRHMKIDRKCYLSHRLAWLYIYGEWPKKQLDHINGDRKDNRIENLRLVCNKQNSENQTLHVNNTSGYRGVTWDKSAQKWMAQIRHNNVRKFIGRYESLKEAANAAKNARDQLFTHHNTEYAA